ncbi:MAG: ATP-binding response regulator [Planctomycetota bacterium]
MVRDVALTVQPLVEKNGNTFELRCPADAGRIEADLTRTRQVLFNLLSNAAKFTRDGRVTLEVSRGRAADGEVVRFAVEDTGIGMTDEQLAHVFDEFVQGDASTTRRYGGTGLGLTITRRYCRLMGGDIEASTEHGAGSRFVVTLPVRARAFTEGPVEEAPVAAPAEVAGASLEVLVIDDDESARDLLARALRGEGFAVLAASGARQGLEMARAHRPAAITLDIMMPEMDGWAVLSRLKADPELAEIPVIVVTMLEDRDTGYLLGAADFLTKPVRAERLVEVVRRALSPRPEGRVLLVEDDPETREMLRRSLEPEGWPVQAVEDGRQALAAVEADPPGLVVLDLMMPEMDGFAFLEALRGSRAGRDVPVVVVTAADLTDNDRRRLHGRVSRVLQKGASDREALLHEVRGHLQARLGPDRPDTAPEGASP